MSPPLTYGPAYLGLYAALVLAIACNAFLDIQYGSFGFEMLLWAGIFGYTLHVGWKQQGHADATGQSRQKRVLAIGGLAAVIIFIPIWGFPRAGLYILGILQAAMNCVTTTRRNLYFGLLVSLIMVMFAATHGRADWTMLFYLLPYIVAVVFTLVSEQISRRAQEVRQEGLGLASAGGQGVAIAAATAIILAFGGLLYAATPQASLMHLYWKHGQPGRMGNTSDSAEAGGGGGGGNSGQSASGGNSSQSGGDAVGGMAQPSYGGLPSLAQMREAARRPGMPRLQGSAITAMADVVEGIEEVLRPINLGLSELLDNLKQWLREHMKEVVSALWTLLILALLIAAWVLLREARPMLWLLAHFDYLRLGMLRGHAPGSRGARQYYAAMERLFDLHGLDRPPTANAREYLIIVGRRFDHLRHEATELTLLFEGARYGSEETDVRQLGRMRELYRRVFKQVGRLAPS